jgi:hypothetical protein
MPQSALQLAAQNGRTHAAIELLQAPGGIDVESLCAGRTAAEAARRAGHSGLADVLAAAAQGPQVVGMIAALNDGGAAAGPFDSASARVAALCAAVGAPPPGAAAADAAAASLETAHLEVARLEAEASSLRQLAAAALAAAAAASASAAAAAASPSLPGGARSGWVCAVCMDAGVAAVLRPCFHAAFCVDCADRIAAGRVPCPICRAPVERADRIFFP